LDTTIASGSRASPSSPAPCTICGFIVAVVRYDATSTAMIVLRSLPLREGMNRIGVVVATSPPRAGSGCTGSVVGFNRRSDAIAAWASVRFAS
jgi:hypothetical protein